MMTSAPKMSRVPPWCNPLRRRNDDGETLAGLAVSL